MRWLRFFGVHLVGAVFFGLFAWACAASLRRQDWFGSGLYGLAVLLILANMAYAAHALAKGGKPLEAREDEN